MPVFNPPIPPVIIDTDEVAFTASSGILAANTVYLYVFVLQTPITIANMRVHITATATGTTDMGIYSFDGNTLYDHTGAIANVANTTMNNALTGGNLTLKAGVYFLALCPSNSTDTYERAGSANLSITSKGRAATNTGTVGVLPATTGAIVAAPAIPAFSATLVGGLS